MNLPVPLMLPAQQFVLMDTMPMIVAAIIVGVFSLALVVVIGLWMVKDQ